MVQSGAGKASTSLCGVTQRNFVRFRSHCIEVGIRLQLPAGQPFLSLKVLKDLVEDKYPPLQERDALLEFGDENNPSEDCDNSLKSKKRN